MAGAEYYGAGNHEMVVGAGMGVGDLTMMAGADDGTAEMYWRMLVPTFYAADPLSGSPAPDARIAHIHDSLPLALPSQQARWLYTEPQEEIRDLEETMNDTTLRVANEVSTMQTRIHRFPHRLRGLGGPDNCYVVPTVVAIGPYHHGLPHLQAMEDVKYVEALEFCGNSGLSVEEVYVKILPVADHAYGCYDWSVVAYGCDQYEFAKMMMVDGCFLIQYMLNPVGDQLLIGSTLSSGPSIIKDIFLLENQVPWFVLEALIALHPDEGVRKHIDDFVEMFGGLLTYRRNKENVPRVREEKKDPDPRHLLSLLHITLRRNMPQGEQKSELPKITSPLLTIGAVDLAQKGVRLSVSKAEWFADMKVRTSLFCKLSLSPLFLNDITACWLVNLAALEAAVAIAASDPKSDGYVVSSYLSMLAMLLDREEDVHELRLEGVVSSIFSNEQTLTFFKGISQHLRLGYNYFSTISYIEHYMENKTWRIAIHKFVYNHCKLMVLIVTIAGAFAGIFQALYALKKP